LNPQLQPLVELQTLDLKIAQIKEQQRKLPVLLEAVEAPFREAGEAVKVSTSAVEAWVKQRRDRERDLETHEAQVEKLRARLTELKTNKEYQAHLFEIEMANKRKREIEDQILALMEQIEAGQREVKEAQGRLAEAERTLAQEKARLESLGAEAVQELAQLEQKQKEIAAQIDGPLLERYTKLKASRKDLALAPLRNGICFGCRLQLPPQLVAEVKRSDVLQSCTYCHRILYWEGEVVAVPVATSVPDLADEDEA
jgi:predicted  nucleic acid-binding Zn-ribbon protein